MGSPPTSESKAAISVAPIPGKTFGAVITGVSLSNLTAAETRAIEDAFHEHALLVFPGQFLSEKARVDFARIFGDKFEYEENHFGNEIPTAKRTLSLNLDGLEQAVLENPTPKEVLQKVQVATRYWHSDSTYRPVSAKAGLLSAKVVPSSGGGTGFADMRAAYDALDESTRRRVGDLCAYHSNLYSDARDVKLFPAVDEASYSFHPWAYLRPLVQTHPVTGRRSLQVGRHAFGIPGLSRGDSAELLRGLTDFACQGPRVYEHTYSEGDLVLWDNRCLMHRGLPYDHAERRTLAGTRISGDPSTEGALATPDQGRRVLAEEMGHLRAACGLPAAPPRSSL